MSTERIPPHSIEAEEYLLSCLFLDGNDTMARCICGKVTHETFYAPANRIVFDCAKSLYARGLIIDGGLIHEELKATKQVEAIGGYSQLAKLSSLIPTTSQVNYYIGNLKKMQVVRKIISDATQVVENAYKFTHSDDVGEVINPVEQFIHVVRSGLSDNGRVRPLGQFTIPDENDPNTLLGDRYVCRGHACLIVGGSGMGKSTIAYQASICWALGRSFLGINVTHAQGWINSLHYQSEDEDGDIAEVRECVYQELKLTPLERKLASERVTIITEKVLRGDEFIADMRVTATRLKADLVWINPLHAFLSGDIKDAKVVGDFCRGGLNGANAESKWAYMIPHHTPKPATATGKEPKEKEWNEVMYEGAGSADLVNFCRAVIVLKATKDEGAFNLYLAKRGKKAGVYIEKSSESGTEYLELTTKIPCRHSRNKITFPGRTKETNVMFWEARDADSAPQKTGHGGRPKSNFNDGEFLGCFPDSESEPGDGTAIQRMASMQMGVTRTTLQRNKARLVEEGFLQPFPDNGMRRTQLGDACVNAYLSTKK